MQQYNWVVHLYVWLWILWERINLLWFVKSKSLFIIFFFFPFLWNIALFTIFIYLFIYSTDIDECENSTNLCGLHATCENTVGSYNCTCDNGFLVTSFGCAGKYGRRMRVEPISFIYCFIVLFYFILFCFSYFLFFFFFFP